MLQYDEISPTKDTKSARIAAKLESQILSKKLVAGEFLPSQQELARQFGASSRSIREAFKQLEAKGLVEVSQGRRAMIKSNNLDQFVESLSASIISNNSSNQKFIIDLVQVRNTLSVSAARVLSRLPDRHMAVRELKG
ncbi:MAG: GntR family transcriptional regulator, partial [Bacilli bacterium]